MTPRVAFRKWAHRGVEGAFAALASRAGVFWLDSSSAGTDGSRFSVLACEPFARLRSWSTHVVFELGGRVVADGIDDPLVALERRLREFSATPPAGWELPFCGGAVGFASYELGRLVEPIVGPANSADVPDLNFAWYDAALVWDHLKDCGFLVGAGWRRDPEQAMAELEAWLLAVPTPLHPAVELAPVVWRSNFSRPAFLDAVVSVRRHIAEGEIYQMNLAQCFHGPLPAPPQEVYRRLRALNPAPMAAYMDSGDGCVLLCSSPERFIEVRAGRIRTSPIKGTRPRGRTLDEDAAERVRLLSSEKERAELLMIVDLLRNDLGRVCRFGSVEVSRLHALESFATVHHLVGEVVGELRPDVGPAELLRAVFPGGSITGAPKVRAMQVIDAIEPGRRGVFSGCIGYFSACGGIDLNIAIRTIVCRGAGASFHVGAGIVWDSDPMLEYEETLAKGRALFAALGLSEDDCGT